MTASQTKATNGHQVKYAKNVLLGTVGALGLFTVGTQTAHAATITVKQGDTVWSLAQKYGVSVSDLENSNTSIKKISSSVDLIFGGQQLSLPGQKQATSQATTSSTNASYVVKSGDTLTAIANKLGVSVNQLVKANGIQNQDFILVGQQLNVSGQKAATSTVNASSATTQSSATSQASQATQPVASTATSVASSTAIASTTSSAAASVASVVNSTSTSSSSQVTASSSVASQATSVSAASTATSTSVATSSSASSTASVTKTRVDATYRVASSASQPAAQSTSSSTATTSATSQAVSQTTKTSASQASSSASQTTAATTQSAATTSQSAALQSGSVVSLAVKLASAHIPYVWGGSTTSGMDCSGLVAYVFKYADGVSLPHNTVAQEAYVTKHSVASAQPGDILFWGTPGSTYHDAIYIGNNQYVAAPHAGQNVQIQTISSYFMPSFAGTLK